MNKRIIKVISIVLLLVILLVGYYFLNSKYNFGIPCIFYKITGYKCPGCGITRALFSILNGNIKEAFKYNKLLFIVTPFLIIYFIYKSYIYILDKKESKIINKIIRYSSYTLVIISIIYAILRNI